MQSLASTPAATFVAHAKAAQTTPARLLADAIYIYFGSVFEEEMRNLEVPLQAHCS